MKKACVECGELFEPGSEGEDMCLACWEHFECKQSQFEDEFSQSLESEFELDEEE